MVGLNTVVDPDRQRTIAKNALTELMCVYAAAEALQSATKSLGLSNDDYEIIPIHIDLSETYNATAARQELDVLRRAAIKQSMTVVSGATVPQAQVETLAKQLADENAHYDSRKAKPSIRSN